MSIIVNDIIKMKNLISKPLEYPKILELNNTGELDFAEVNQIGHIFKKFNSYFSENWLIELYGNYFHVSLIPEDKTIFLYIFNLSYENYKQYRQYFYKMEV